MGTDRGVCPSVKQTKIKKEPHSRCENNRCAENTLPYFCLLRYEVTFVKRKMRKSSLSSDSSHILPDSIGKRPGLTVHGN